MKRKKNKKGSSFTLLEILLAFALLSSVAGLLVLKLPALFDGRRVTAAAEKLEARLLLAQELMLAYQIDLTVVLTCYQEELRVTMELPQALHLPFVKQATAPLKLSEIKKLYFNGVSCEQVMLTFEAKDSLITRGKLTVMGKQKSITLLLPGYPSPILKEENGRTLYDPPPATYPEAALSFT